MADNVPKTDFINCHNLSYQKATWMDFERAAVNRKVVLFGVGMGAERYFRRYRDKFLPEFIVDNDITLQGKAAPMLLAEIDSPLGDHIIIRDSSALDDINKQEFIVVICSLRRYQEIATQLEEVGLNSFFSVFCMDANARIDDTEYDLDNRSGYFMNEGLRYPINHNKVCILSWMGDFSGHGKEIASQLQALRPGLDIVWLIRDWKIVPPKGIRVAWRHNQRTFYRELETAKFFLFDDNVLPGIHKREGQIFIQMKHWSSVTLKMFGYDEARYRNDAQMMNKMCSGDIMDYVISGSVFDEKTCRSGFNFKGRFIRAGSPRSDILFRCNDELVSYLRKRYDLSEGTRYLLYAPTYRLTSNGWSEVVYQSDMDFAIVKEALEKRFGGRWGILLRLHPFVAKYSHHVEHPYYVTDVSDYYDSEELVAFADILVTDYSSIMFEPAFVRKPTFLLTTDRMKYLDIERGFLIEYDSLPFSIANNNDELVQNIESFDNSKYVRDLDAFLEKYGVHEDGHAGERAAKFILDLIDGKRS